MPGWYTVIIWNHNKTSKALLLLETRISRKIPRISLKAATAGSSVRRKFTQRHGQGLKIIIHFFRSF